MIVVRVEFLVSYSRLTMPTVCILTLTLWSESDIYRRDSRFTFYFNVTKCTAAPGVNLSRLLVTTVSPLFTPFNISTA